MDFICDLAFLRSNLLREDWDHEIFHLFNEQQWYKIPSLVLGITVHGMASCVRRFYK